MQVFLPYPEFDRSVAVLDPKRLGNQVYRECKVLITGGWPHHPAAKMWTGYFHALAKYAIAGLDELKKRGRNYPHHRKFFQWYIDNCEDTGMPMFIGNEQFHSSHRSNLLKKRPEWYKQFGWTEPDNLPYYWPV